MARHGSSPRPQDLGGGGHDAAAPARQAGRQQERAGQPGRQAARQPQAEALEHVGGTVAVRIGQVLARAAQQREIAHRLVVHQRGFLGELAHRQRRGIGFLGTRQHAAVQQPVQRRAHDGRVGGRGVGRRARRRWQQRPVVDGIEQPDDDEGRQDHGRTWPACRARHAPGGAQRRTAAHVPGVGQHPNAISQSAISVQSKTILGMAATKRTRGRPACRKYRPGSGPRCRARRPGTPWRARWKSPAR